jgi:hypothetical protein
MVAKVFISYRRHDAKYQARMVYNAFRAVLPRESIFMDVDSIPLGADFVEVLEGWVERCEVLVALIGSGWADAIDPKTSRKRLENDTDFVRIEIRQALKRGIPVVPVLLDGTPMPEPEDLPDDLKKLVRRQAEFVDFRTFDADVERLIKKLSQQAEAERQRREAEAKRRAEEDARQRAKEERRKREAEIEQRGTKEAEAERQADEESKRKTEEESKQQEVAAQRQAEAERQRREADAKRPADEETRRRAEEEERRKREAEMEQRRKNEAEPSARRTKRNADTRSRRRAKPRRSENEPRSSAGLRRTANGLRIRPND